MQSAECGIADALDRHDLASGDETDGHDATVHRAIGRFAVRTALDDGDGARATVAFGATFLRTGETGVAEIFE